MTEINIDHVMKLSRLGLTEEEKSRYGRQLAEVLKYIEQLNEVDVSGIEPMAHATGLSNVIRVDEGREAAAEAVVELIKAAPDHAHGFIKVKRVF